MTQLQEPSNRAAPRAAAVLALCLLVGACVSAPTPGVSPELLDSARQPHQDSVALMRRQGEAFAGVSFLPGNQVDLLIDGPATFAAMAQAIGGARRRIDMESYEFDATAGDSFTDLLLAARRRGVEVNLIYDAWGAVDTPEALFDRLRAGGVKVLEFNPIGPNDRVGMEFNKRDHRKLLAVDGRLVITGGVNISEVYRNRPAPAEADANDQAWRDTDVRITGPVVAQFESYFMESWAQQHGPPLKPPPATPAAAMGPLLVQAIDGAPDSEQPLIYRTLLASITLARRSVHLTTGFFVPTPDMTSALIAAAGRGVDVRLVVPGHSTSDAALAAGRAGYDELLEHGVRIYERQGRILHAKTAVIDGGWSAIGSANLDWRSAVWNNEIAAIVLGPAFGGKMETMFAADEAASVRIRPEGWRERDIGERLHELGAKLVEVFL